MLILYILNPKTFLEAEVKKMAKKKANKKSKQKTVRCAAKTRDGKRCKNYATGKSKYCNVHKNASSRGPKKKKACKKKVTKKKTTKKKSKRRKKK